MPPPPTGISNASNSPVSLEQFEGQGALAGHHRRIVVGVDEHQPVLGGETAGVERGLHQRVAVQHHPGAPGGGAGHLGRGGEQRHHDGGVDPGEAGMACDRLGMVAGGTWQRRRPGARRPSAGASLLAAPRSLNEPMACRLSSLRVTWAPGRAADGVRIQRGCADHPAGDAGGAASCTSVRVIMGGFSMRATPHPALSLKG